MNEQHIDRIAQDTALDILKRHAPDCLQRDGLRDAIAGLARLGLQSSFRLYRLQHRQQPEEISSRQSIPGGGQNGQPPDIGNKPGDTTPTVAADAARPEGKINTGPIEETAVL